MDLILLYLAFPIFWQVICASPINDPFQNRHRQSISKFWHISDLHLDPTYHITEDPTKVCFSSKGFPVSDPGLFGDFLCDSPYQLIESAFSYMKDVDLEPEFIIWTGDSPPHVPVDKLSTDTVVSVISNMTHTIRQFFPQLPVYPALGNHDYWPQDQLAVNACEVYKAAASLWLPWLHPEALATLREGGFYSQLIKPDLRLVSLNTNLYYSPNKVTVNMTDPGGQLQWLEDTLALSRQSGEKAYVIAHVPIGYLPYAKNTTAMRGHFNERLVDIFRNYSDIIQGHFYGHTHRNSIMVLLDHQGKPVNSVFVTPAVTPIRNLLETYSNNPAVRMYLYNSQNYGLQDLWQFYLNLTEANKEGRPSWRLEYIMTKAFDIKDIQPESLYELALKFEVPESKAFQKYFNYFMTAMPLYFCSQKTTGAEFSGIAFNFHSVILDDAELMGDPISIYELKMSSDANPGCTTGNWGEWKEFCGVRGYPVLIFINPQPTIESVCGGWSAPTQDCLQRPHRTFKIYFCSHTQSF